MGLIYSSQPYECPHCFYTGLFWYGDTRLVGGVEWLFYKCPRCGRWVATREGEEMRKLFDLPFLPLGLRNPTQGDE